MSMQLESSAPIASPLRAVEPSRSTASAMLRGWMHRCPNCGNGRLFERYLKIADRCQVCSQELHHHRADDAPPYFTIFLVGHIILGGVLSLEQYARPSPWLQAAIWLPLTLILTLWLLPRIKGALVGLQWALRMHGFEAAPEAPPVPSPSSETLRPGTSTTA